MRWIFLAIACVAIWVAINADNNTDRGVAVVAALFCGGVSLKRRVD